MNLTSNIQSYSINFHDNVTIISANQINIFYSGKLVVENFNLQVPKNKITALIGPSGCGKSSVIRSFNRMNDIIPGFSLEGEIIYKGKNIYSSREDPVRIRRQIGMVFQKPNPFPKSIYENVAFGARINKYQGDLDELVESSLIQAALWDEVKDKLKESAYALSGGQQQRLCIARAIAVSPDILLMDEPASALDPVATLKIEELMQELKEKYTIIVVTHNMQQASRVSDFTAFMSLDREKIEDRIGVLVEFDETTKLFTNPKLKETEDYITGRFG
ncbi:MAG: phosphate ABC transporter ATP-binding protein [Chloroflexi bacterium HGW-Chloroflexi-2]|jgi:phosphate transport system ATP-binding protein|nr:MAG: phosphate ABC transporter ATP-binding protein [Chloroflexi bacterium HGW-Chloroflexi-2]